MKLTYTQWFALLALKHFSPCKADGVVRRNTLESLASRGLATEGTGGFWITGLGVLTEDRIEHAPRH